MKLYGMRKADLDQEAQIVFKLVFTHPMKRDYDKGYQEAPILINTITNAIATIGSTMRQTLVYDGKEVGRWELGPASLQYQESLRAAGR